MEQLVACSAINHIFANLRLQDWNHLRRVCKKWNDSSGKWLKFISALSLSKNIFAGLTTFLQNGQILRELHLGGRKIKKALPLLRYFSHLERFHLYTRDTFVPFLLPNSVSDLVIACKKWPKFQDFTNLKHLRYLQINQHTDQIIESFTLEQFQNLIGFRAERVTTEIMMSLVNTKFISSRSVNQSQLPAALQVLEISSSGFFTFNFLSLPDSLQALSYFPIIGRFNMDNFFSKLRPTNLQKLQINLSGGFPREGISRLSGLIELCIWIQCQTEQTDLKELSTLGRLTTLTLITKWSRCFVLPSLFHLQKLVICHSHPTEGLFDEVVTPEMFPNLTYLGLPQSEFDHRMSIVERFRYNLTKLVFFCMDEKKVSWIGNCRVVEKIALTIFDLSPWGCPSHQVRKRNNLKKSIWPNYIFDTIPKTKKSQFETERQYLLNQHLMSLHAK